MRKKYIERGLVLILAIMFITPLVLTFVYSFSKFSYNEDKNCLENLMPKGFSLEGYYDFLIKNSRRLYNFWNSVLYAGTITLLNIIIAIPAAFSFYLSKNEKKGKALFYVYIILMMMPLQVTLLPNYIGLRDMKLLGTGWAVILPAVFAPFGVFLLAQYMRGIESSCIEASLLETKSVFSIILNVVLPQLKPCIAAAFVFLFAEHWNMVEQPKIFLKKEELLPLSSMLSLGGKMSVPEVLAGSVIYIIPIVILYMYFHESLEEGLENLKL